MADIHDVVVFSVEGEKILGIVIEHYTNPLDDFYIIYADYTLYKVSNPEDNASIIIENIIIPACDAAISDYRLHRQHLKDIDACHKEFEAIKEAIISKMDIGNLFEDNSIK